MQGILIQIFFGIELIILQFVLYVMLYPTRCKKIVTKRKEIIILGSLSALGAGILSCIASGNFAFFKWDTLYLLSEKITCIWFYIVCSFIIVCFLLVLSSRIFHWKKEEKREWFHIHKENIQLYENYSRTATFTETNVTGEWTVGHETYYIIFKVPVHKEDMMVELVQKDKFTFICNKAVLLGKPTRSEHIMSILCICARFLFFASTWRANIALFEHKEQLFSQNQYIIIVSALMLGSAWMLLSGLTKKTDKYGYCIRAIYFVVLIISVIEMLFLNIEEFFAILLVGACISGIY